MTGDSKVRNSLIWCAIAFAIIVPIVAAAYSPLLAWRDPIYIAAGFAGIIAMGLLLLQPLLAGDISIGLTTPQRRQVHRIIGSLLILAIVIHVGALWMTSPPDVIDALLFASPTPFSVWGVIAMLAVLAAALLAAFRQRLGIKPSAWRLVHTFLVVVTVLGSVVHALLIEGTMETITKISLCGAVVIVTFRTVIDRKAWRFLTRRTD